MERNLGFVLGWVKLLLLTSVLWSLLKNKWFHGFVAFLVSGCKKSDDDAILSSISDC